MKKFTITSAQVATMELANNIDTIYTAMYGTISNHVKQSIENKLSATNTERFKLSTKLSVKFDATMSHADVIKFITDNYPKDQRTLPYKYANLTRRSVLLASILTSTMKISTVVQKTLKGLIEAELYLPKGKSVTISELIVKCPLRPTHIVHKNGEHTELTDSNEDKFIIDEIKLQFINELVELDLIDMRISQHTHMVETPSKLIPSNIKPLVYSSWEIAQVVSKKTVLLEPAPIDFKDAITRSSWFYRTPNLSAAQVEYMTAMNNIKYRFKADALNRLEECYIEHLRDDNGNLPTEFSVWGPAKIEFFREQIIASNENGGHYIQHKWDSSLRTYMISEIGHFQTSKALRSLVEVDGIDNPIKKDFKNNVIQMYSILMKVRDLGKYVGLLPEVDREEDVRSQLAKSLNAKLECDIFNKDIIKPLFMVWAYNAGKDRILDGDTISEEQFLGSTIEVVKTPGLIALTGAANTPANRDLLWSAFEESVIEYVPAVVVLKTLFKKLIKCNPLTETSWTLPDGSIAQYASPARIQDTLFWVTAAGKQHQHTHSRKVIETNEKSAGLLPRVIHSFDAYVARQIVIRASRLGIIVIPNHDSFMYDIKHDTTIDRIISEIFSELLESNAFADVIKELNTSGKSLAIKTANGDIINDESMYSAYGRLTVEDLAQANPTDLEEI